MCIVSFYVTFVQLAINLVIKGTVGTENQPHQEVNHKENH